MTEVIALLSIGILLIVLNFNAIRKDKKSFSGTLKDKEDNIKDYEIEIGKLRRELSETVLELQKEIENLKLGKEANVNNDLEDREMYKNLYGRTSYNDENAIGENLQTKPLDEGISKELLNELQSIKNNDEVKKVNKENLKYKRRKTQKKIEKMKVGNKINLILIKICKKK